MKNSGSINLVCIKKFDTNKIELIVYLIIVQFKKWFNNILF